MEYFLFAGYLVLFAWLVTKVKFFKDSGLTQSQLVIVFLLKVMAGILYGWVGIYYGYYAQMVDTWMFHYEAIKEKQILFQNPGEYLTNIFHNPYTEGYTKFLVTENSYWNDLKSNAIIKMLSVFDIFSFNNYYVNIIFYSFITLIGPIAIYRVMKDVFPGKGIQLGIAVFLLPSFLYWTSGIHKEGLIFLGISLIIYQLYFWQKEKRFSWKRMAFTFIGLLMVLTFRNFVFVIILPAIVAWLFASRFKGKELKVYAILYLLYAVAFFSLRYIHPKLDFPYAVALKQKQFMELQGGNSVVQINHLEPTTIGFIKDMPQAFSLSTLRPYPSDVKHLLSLAASVEISLFILLFIILLFNHTKSSVNRSFILFCLFFAVTVLLSIGYTVNLLGAIVRYRSIALPFLVVPMVALIDWNKTSSLLFNSNRSSVNPPG